MAGQSKAVVVWSQSRGKQPGSHTHRCTCSSTSIHCSGRDYPQSRTAPGRLLARLFRHCKPLSSNNLKFIQAMTNKKKSLLWALLRVKAALRASLRQPCLEKISLTLFVVFPAKSCWYLCRYIHVKCSNQVRIPLYWISRSEYIPFWPGQYICTPTACRDLSWPALPKVWGSFHRFRGKPECPIFVFKDYFLRQKHCIIPMLMTSLKSGTCIPIPPQSVLSRTWMCLHKESCDTKLGSMPAKKSCQHIC